MREVVTQGGATARPWDPCDAPHSGIEPDAVTNVRAINSEEVETMNEFETDLAKTEASMRRLLKLFTATLLVLVLGVGGWAVASKVESAVIATGNFVVSSNGQAVQHLHGGVVGRILVKDGDRVEKGQLVIELDSAKVRAELGIIKRQLIDLAAERARLIAERDGEATIKRPKILQGNAANSNALNAALMLQQTLLQSRTDAFRSQLMQLKEQMEQTENGIAGLRSLKRAREEELAQVSDDLEAYLELDRKRLIRRSVLRQTKRQVSRLRGDILEITSRLSSHQSKRSETKFRMREIKRKTRSENSGSFARGEVEDRRSPGKIQRGAGSHDPPGDSRTQPRHCP